MRTIWSLLPVAAALGCLAFPTMALAQRAPHGSQAPGGAPSGPIQVGVITLHPQAVPITQQLPGRVSASQTADVRPQVGGVIKAIDFKAGQPVKAGDKLYEIDDAAYAAQVDVQSAAVQKATAAVSAAQAQFGRDQQLAKTNNISQSDLQTAQVTLIQAQADVASAQASLKAAQINEALTAVASPISGIISDTAVPVGSLVTAAQTTALATVYTLDPSYVDLVTSSTDLLKTRAQFRAGTLKGAGRPGTVANVHLTLEDGSAYPDAGTLTIANVVVSESTGSFTLRASFPNAHRLLLPGMFVRATVELGTNPKGFLVPQRSVTFNAAGQPTAFFVVDGKAVSTVLTTDGNVGNDWLVTSGVTDGAQVVVDGLQNVTDGATVTAVPVTIDDNGVATATTSSTPATSPAPSPATTTPSDATSSPNASSAPAAPAAPTPAPSTAATPATTTPAITTPATTTPATPATPAAGTGG
jgi:membrane fusion protein (multidrug efflux system)